MQKSVRTRATVALSVFGVSAAAVFAGVGLADSAHAGGASRDASFVAAADTTMVRAFRSTTVDNSALGGIGTQFTARAQVAVTDVAAAATPPPPQTYCPAPGSRFVNSWGAPRSGGRAHKGVDMMAPHGSPVLAPVAGTVRHSHSSLGGLGFYLLDENGTEYFGTHMQTLGPEGYVEAGTQLGTVGSTGNASASGPHLHFEIVPAGQGNVNPYPYTDAWCADH